MTEEESAEAMPLVMARAFRIQQRQIKLALVRFGLLCNHHPKLVPRRDVLYHGIDPLKRQVA
jgi:hypothetical protein